MKMKIIVGLLSILLISCKNSKICHRDIICDLNKEECKDAHKKAQESCGEYLE